MGWGIKYSINTKSSHVCIFCDWQDPRNNRLFQWNDVKLSMGLIQLAFPLSSEPALGPYKLMVEKSFMEIAQHPFDVEEYGKKDEAYLWILSRIGYLIVFLSISLYECFHKWNRRDIYGSSTAFLEWTCDHKRDSSCVEQGSWISEYWLSTMFLKSTSFKICKLNSQDSPASTWNYARQLLAHWVIVSTE